LRAHGKNRHFPLFLYTNSIFLIFVKNYIN
jgi:hypothetical protein